VEAERRLEVGGRQAHFADGGQAGKSILEAVATPRGRLDPRLAELRCELGSERGREPAQGADRAPQRARLVDLQQQPHRQECGGGEPHRRRGAG
jgi:hypothetical protein